MTLEPKLPPGRANRKALAFASEIQRLRAIGYSFEAIRIALADAGLVVSRTTVKREAARVRRRPAQTTPQRIAVSTDPATVAPATVYQSDRRSGRDIAAAFAAQLITNPLLRERQRHEARSD